MKWMGCRAVCVAILCAVPAVSSADDPAELILTGGNVITVDRQRPRAEAVAVRDGRIVAVGSNAEVMKLKAPQTRNFDLAGHTLLPGFIDPHSHFTNAMLATDWANVSAPPVGTVRDIPGLVAELKHTQRRNHTKPGQWIVGYGFDPSMLREKRMLGRDDLDPAFPDNPVMVLHVSLHGCVLNSAGFKKVGIDANTKTPDGGVILRKPGSNVPAGLLMENAFLAIVPKMPKPTDEQRLAAIKPAQDMYARNGYTTMQEGATQLEDLALLQKAAERKLLFLDLVSLPFFTAAKHIVGQQGYTFGTYDNRLKLGGIKNVTDGSPQGKTAYWTLPLLTKGPAGQSMWRGQPNMTQKTLDDVYRLCYQHDVQVYSHANGDAAIDMVIQAHKAAAGKEKKDRRPVVVHSQFVRPDQLDDYVALGMFPSFFTNHAFFWGDVHVKNLGYRRAAFLSPLNTAGRKGLRFTNHTDYLVTPLNPMFTVYTATTRVSRSGEVIGPGQRVSPMVALEALTINAAHQYFEEDTKGSIEVGKLADLVVLDKNPLTTDRYQIKDIKVVATFKEGKQVFGQP